MAIFLCVQNTYDRIELALFNNKACIDVMQENKKGASKVIIPMLSILLQRNTIRLGDLSFIAANQGPGPFTTLRVVIATVNGLGFATKLPLIGIDGLHAFIRYEYTSDYPNTVALLDAFNNDVYFAFYGPAWPERQMGYNNIKTVLEAIAAYNIPVRLIGNAVDLHREAINRVLGSNAHIIEPVPLYATIEQIGLTAYEKWETKTDISQKLSPLYLKLQYYKNQQGIFTAC